jgi:hypothetical protein
MRRATSLLAAFALLASAQHAAAQEVAPPPHRPPPPRRIALDESNAATVTVQSDEPGTYLEAFTVEHGWIHLEYRWHSELVYGRFPRWRAVCVAPCSMRVPAFLHYRVGGPSMPPSDAFDFSAGSAHSLRVKAGSRAGMLGGGLLIGFGIASAIVGAVLASASHDGTQTAGFVTLGAGGAMIIGGAALVATSGTNVYDENGARVGSIGPKIMFGPNGFAF